MGLEKDIEELLSRKFGFHKNVQYYLKNAGSSIEMKVYKLSDAKRVRRALGGLLNKNFFAVRRWKNTIFIRRKKR